MINVLDSFLNQNFLEAFRSECEEVNDHIDASLYQSYFEQLNYEQKRLCLFKIYEQLLELNEELGCPKCELYSAYNHNFRKPFRPERYFALDDPEVNLCFLLILSVIYPEIGNFVRDHKLNKIKQKDKLCKILDIDKMKLKEVFKFLYVDMGLIQRFNPEITIDYVKFFRFMDKKTVLKYLRN